MMDGTPYRIFYVDDDGQARYFVKRDKVTSSDVFSDAYLQARKFPSNALAGAYARMLADAYRGRYFELEEA